MKHFLAIASLSLLVACGGGAETEVDPTVDAPVGASAAEQSIAEMGIPTMADRMITDGQQLGDLLAMVTSAESAELVRPNIEAMIKDYKLMFDRFETMEQPSFSDMAALASRGARLAETQQTVMSELRRIYNDHPEAADVLRDALGGFGRP